MAFTPLSRMFLESSIYAVIAYTYLGLDYVTAGKSERRKELSKTAANEQEKLSKYWESNIRLKKTDLYECCLRLR